MTRFGFETACGLARGTVSSINKGMRSDKLAKIAKRFPEINTTWLLTGEGEMIAKIPEPSAEDDQIKELNETIALLRDVIKDMRAQITELRSK